GLARDPEAIPFTAANLNTALQRLNTTFRWGPSRHMVWTMDVSFTPFQQYTAKDCPHYGDLYGPRCGGPSVPNSAPPQQYPPQLLPGWLDSAGPRPTIPAPPVVSIPGIPPLPGLPVGPSAPGPALPPLAGIPGAPVIPGLTAPAAVHPAALRGPDAIAAVVGGPPNTAQLLLLGPVLAGGHLTVSEGGAGQ
ncbi:mammalian cell entry protein, partial [Nocardia gipuzkoensis]